MEFGDQRSCREDAVKEALTQQSGLRTSGWASEERERHNVDGHKFGGQNIEVSVRSPTPSHTKTLNNPFGHLQIKWEINIIVKEVFLRLYHCVHLYCCVVMIMSIQHFVGILLGGRDIYFHKLTGAVNNINPKRKIISETKQNVKGICLTLIPSKLSLITDLFSVSASPC